MRVGLFPQLSNLQQFQGRHSINGGVRQRPCLPLCFFPNMYQLCRVHFSTLVVTFKIKVFPVSFGANNLKCVIVPSCADSKCIENTRDFWTHKHNLSSPLGSLARFGSLQFSKIKCGRTSEKIKIQGALKFIQMLIFAHFPPYLE